MPEGRLQVEQELSTLPENAPGFTFCFLVGFVLLYILFTVQFLVDHDHYLYVCPFSFVHCIWMSVDLRLLITPIGIFKLFLFILDKAAYITVLQQNYNGQLNVLCRATGDDCGGASVTDRFCNMLEEIIGGNVIAELKKQEPADWRELLQQVRIRIEAFQTRMTSLLNFRIPEGLYYVCLRLHGKDLKYAIGSSSYARILRIKPDAMIKLFTPTIDSIITLMKNTVANKSTNGLSNILMVGEFSECSLIQEAVKKAFPDKQIIIPKDAGLSVLNGAVLFGHRPNYIRSVKGDSLEDDDDDDDDDDDGCIGK
jgi:hypothetical protein